LCVFSLGSKVAHMDVIIVN